MTISTPFAWTDLRVQTLKRLFEAGLSSSQIGAKLGVSRNAVIGKVLRLGLKRGGSTKPKVKDTTLRAPKSAPRLAAAPVQVVAPQPMPDGMKIGHMAITDLRKNQCRMECSGQDKVELFRFCGASTPPDQPYCAAHARVCYRKDRAA